MAQALDNEVARNEYFDRQLNIAAVKLLPGEYHVTNREMVQVTVLGSCVAACIRDRISGVGGMNHFMLPDAGVDGLNRFGASSRYGVYAMEVLINQVLKLGARRNNLEAKVFGGGNVMKSLTMSNVGTRNAQFVLEFLDTENIRVVAKDLEDIHPRKVYHFPRSGKVRVKKIVELHNQTIFERESSYGSRIRETATGGGDIELFS